MYVVNVCSSKSQIETASRSIHTYIVPICVTYIRGSHDLKLSYIYIRGVTQGSEVPVGMYDRWIRGDEVL